MSRVAKAPKPAWTISSARQHLPALVAASAREPQAIYRRNHLVAAVLAPEALAELATARHTTLGSAFARLRQICREDDYNLIPAPRDDRPNPFAPPRK